MAINKEADFIMKDGRAIYPPVISDESLKLWYDTKGKKNSDKYKDKMFDMSGNKNHGTLENFDYKNLSGYQEDSQLVFDGVDDKMVLGDIEKPEIVSATRNLLNEEEINNQELYRVSGSYLTTDISIDTTKSYSVSAVLKEGKERIAGLTVFFVFGVGDNGDPNRTTNGQGRMVANGTAVASTITPSQAHSNVTGRFSYYPGGVSINDILDRYNFQIEEGSVATPYVPYIPSTRGSYQINNNIISYNGDTVSWVKDGKVIERKGVNLIKDSFYEIGKNKTGGTITVNFKQVAVPNFTEGHYYLTAYESKHNDVVSGVGVYPRANMVIGSAVDKTNIDTASGIWDKTIKIDKIPSGVEGSGRMYLRMVGGLNSEVEYRNLQLIDLTATFGAGNEPTLEEIQAEPDKWQWLPNPMDLVEVEELKGNILGDMEDIIDDHTRDEQSGLEAFTDKADDSLVRVEVDGKSYQHAGSGKNLVRNFDERTWSYQGLNYHIDKYNIITINGTSERIHWTGIDVPMNLTWGSVDWHNKDLYLLKENTDYILSVNAVSGNYSGSFTVLILPKRDSYKFENSIQSIDFRDSTIVNTGSDNLYSHFIIRANEGTVFNNFKFKLQLEEGSTATPYEPPAPTPDYPIEIHSLNDFDVVSSVGKRNLLVGRENGNYRLNSNNGNTNPTIYKSYEDYDSVKLTAGAQLSTYSSEVFTLEKGKEYTGSMYVYSPVRLDLSIISYSGNVWTTVPANKWTRLSNTFIGTGERQRFASLFSRNAGALNHEIFYNRIKLEEGEISRYSPAPEDITESDNHLLIDEINLLLSEPLRSVGDVKDRLYRDSDGLWKVERNTTEVHMGSGFKVNSDVTKLETPEGLKEYARGGYTTIGMNGYTTHINSTHFSYNPEPNTGSSAKKYHIGRNWSSGGLAHNIHFVVPEADFPTLDLFNNWLVEEEKNGKPVTLQIQLRPEYVYTENLDQELQDKLNNLRSFQDSNYVYTIINEVDDLASHISENLKPIIHTEFLAKDHFKESRTVNNLLIWNRSLEDEELLSQNKLFHERFNMRSNTVKGEPITQTINLTQGGYAANTLSLEYTIEI